MFRFWFPQMLSVFILSTVVSTGCSDSSSDNSSDAETHAKSNRLKQTASVPQNPTLKTDDENRAKFEASPTSFNPEAQPASSASTKGTSAGKFDWPHWRGPNGNGTSSEKNLIHSFPADGPNIFWRKQLGTGFSGLTVANGRLFTLFGEGGREKIVCFNADTGEQIWIVDSDADFAQGRSYGPRSTPCVDGNRVYAVGASGMVHCLEADTGKKIWSFNIYDQFHMRRFFHEEGVSCSPVIDGKKLIILAGIHAFAFDKTNGKVIWKVMEEKMNHSTPTFATLNGQRQLIVLTGSHLVGLDPASGKERWRHEQRAVNCVTPVIGPGNQIFTAAAYGFGCQLVKVNGDSVTQVYKNQALATHHGTAILHQGHLYGFHDRPGIFKCVEFATGNEKWSSRSPGKSKAILADGMLVLITEFGDLVLVKPSPNGYSELAKARILKGTCYTAPTLANGKLYVRSNREMVCIDMKRP
ncbi:MAG: hypothetical protein Tsb009_05270 [Planctomycetaceae bacterium]